MVSTSASRSGLVAWLLALAAVVTVVLLVVLDDEEQPGPISPPVISAADPVVRDLAARLDRLEQQLMLLQLAAESEPSAAPLRAAESWSQVPTSGFDAQTLEGLEARLAQLEVFEGERQRELAEKAAARERELERQREAQLAERDWAHALILDPERSDIDKTKAWLQLSRLDIDAWSDEVVLEMARIGALSEDDRAREVAWIGADSSQRSDLIVEPLMQALASDPEEDVREEAADALGNYLHVQGVIQALKYASLHDVSEQVREEALASLSQGG